MSAFDQAFIRLFSPPAADVSEVASLDDQPSVIDGATAAIGDNPSPIDDESSTSDEPSAIDEPSASDQIDPLNVPTAADGVMHRLDATADRVMPPHFQLTLVGCDAPEWDAAADRDDNVDADGNSPKDAHATHSSVNVDDEKSTAGRGDESELTGDNSEPTAETFESTGDSDLEQLAQAAATAMPERPRWSARHVAPFQWPSICDELVESAGDAFAAAASTLFEPIRNGRPFVAITSLRAGEGRTTFALCLAQWAAQQGASVALIDQHPSQMVALLCPSLSSDDSIDSSIDNSVGDDRGTSLRAVATDHRVTVFAAPPRDRKSHRAAPHLSAAELDDLADDFDIVLADLGVLNDAPADRLAASLPGATAVLVCDARRKHGARIQAARDRLGDAGLEHVGVVENFLHPASAIPLIEAA